VLVAGGQDQTEAYRNAYSASGMKQTSVRVEACREAKKPHVARAIAWLRKNRPRSEELALEVLDELFVCEKLQEVAVSATHRSCHYPPGRTSECRDS
jgi:hypothetical protein